MVVVIFFDDKEGVVLPCCSFLGSAFYSDQRESKRLEGKGAVRKSAAVNLVSMCPLGGEKRVKGLNCTVTEILFFFVENRSRPTVPNLPFKRREKREKLSVPTHRSLKVDKALERVCE